MTRGRRPAPADLGEITERLIARLGGLSFGPPVRYVYRPLVYAGDNYRTYLARHGSPPREVVFTGMNPGPWGMVQTGIPFGEVGLVREWLRIARPVGRPEREHPKRPVTGFECPRREVSGLRVWGWARKRFGTPERFFGRFFIANYCPLAFFDEGGRNLTPDKLPAAMRLPLVEICDEALRSTVALLAPRIVLGFGRFAEERARQALAGLPARVAYAPHPSPASPRANRGWEEDLERTLAELGVAVP